MKALDKYEAVCIYTIFSIKSVYEFNISLD